MNHRVKLLLDLITLKAKLNNDINAKLSVDELKIIYGLDSNYYKYNHLIDKYINFRNKYDDLCKLFGKKCVAKELSEITMDTICYIGNLEYYEILPTYNLRYIYGSLFYGLNEVYNLENLEKVFGDTHFEYIESAEGLDNLEIIEGCSIFKNLKSSEGLYNLRKIGKDAKFPNLESAIYLNSLEEIGKCAIFNKLKSAKGLYNLKKIGNFASFPFLESAEGLNKLESIYGVANFNSLISPRGLEHLKNPGTNQYYGDCFDFFVFKHKEQIECIKKYIKR